MTPKPLARLAAPATGGGDADEQHKPYTSGELMRMAGAIGGPKPLDPMRVLATYAESDNWTAVNGRDDRGPRNYWAWTGPTIVGYELAGWPLRDAESLAAACSNLEAQVEMLATVLMDEFGGPTQSESACEMAVRVLREQDERLKKSP